MSKNNQSVEPQIVNLTIRWLESYGLPHGIEQGSIGNTEIDNALKSYESKSGGAGGNRPDIKLLRSDKFGNLYPVLIECKGYEDKLEKLDDQGHIANKTQDNKPYFQNIKTYAVNGAVHYANAILHYTSFENIISIGITGYEDDFGVLQHKIGVYHVSKSNFGVGQKVGEFSDLSFLKHENFDDFIEKIKALSLSEEEKEQIKQKLEQEIKTVLTELNNSIFKDDNSITEKDRVYLVAASIIATLGISPLDKSELKSRNEKENRDGDILIRKVEGFLDSKDIPSDKKELIVRTLKNTITSEKLNKVINGETKLKIIFSKIVDDLGIYYKTDLNTDFTGKLFNEMYGWLGFSQDNQNDVVLTPSYVATLLARLARVNKDSYVWDFATGSAGLLVAAMNEMIKDAEATITSPDELRLKIAQIKAKQLLGLEILDDIYMLAVLNMILMGDGSSNILNKDSLNDFSGNYGFGENNGEEFPATAFVLNPPYSKAGCGMVFVAKALKMMKKGYAAIIIQHSVGTGKGAGKGKGGTKAEVFNKEILTHSTLLASIKMPINLFIGKASVQTYIYVFRVGEKHDKNEIVKFIDFSNDGYARQNKKKARAEVNLRDTGDAKARYDELVNLVRFGRSKLNIFSDKEYYEDTIDPSKGNDWNKCAPVDTKPTLNDFKTCVSDYLAWEVGNIIKNEQAEPKDLPSSNKLESAEWGEFRIGDLFDVENTWIYGKNKQYFTIFKEKVKNSIPVISGITINNGVNYYTTDTLEDNEVFSDCLTISTRGEYSGTVTYHKGKFALANNILTMTLNDKWSEKSKLFFATLINSLGYGGYSGYPRKETLKNDIIQLPITASGEIDFDFMESFISELLAERNSRILAYLKASNLADTTLSADEQNALNTWNSKTWGEFELQKLFTFKGIKQSKSQKKIPTYTNGIPYIVQSTTNNMCARYVNRQYLIDTKEPPNKGNAIALGVTLPAVSYQPIEFGASQIIEARADFLNKINGLFFVTSISKQMYQFSYQNKPGIEIYKKLKIKLPVTQNGEIDFDFMENFIKAVQKECIKGVDSYLAKNIVTTKQAISEF